jgi:hypothetical protein
MRGTFGRDCWDRVIVGDGRGNSWLHIPEEGDALHPALPPFASHDEEFN